MSFCKLLNNDNIVCVDGPKPDTPKMSSIHNKVFIHSAGANVLYTSKSGTEC